MGKGRASRPPRGEDWSEGAIALLERAVAYHGGWDRWDRLRRISLTPTSLSGFLPWLKGVGRTFHLPATIEIVPHERKTIFHEYPEAGQRGVFEGGAIRIEAASGDRNFASIADHRSSFRGLSKNRRWSLLDALYFFGYALWHYHAVPFTLGDARLLGVRQAKLDGEALFGLDVVFPPDVPTHCSRQTFYFDESGCVRRHDYVADVIGGWARGAHFWKNYQFIDGVAIASERHVRPLMLGQLMPATALRATFTELRVELAAPIDDSQGGASIV